METDKINNKEQEMLKQLNKASKEEEANLFSCIKNTKVMVVYGGTGSGKSSFCFKLLQFSDRPVYIFNHPKPNLIKALGYKIINTSGLSRISDAIVWFDEPQLYFDKYEKRSNEMFLKLCSLARQNDLTMIFSTSDTRWVNKGLESYVSHWIVKNLDINLVKNGSAVKTVVKEVLPLAENELDLDVNEFLFYSRKDRMFNGLHSFEKPAYFTDELSKAWKNKKIC